MVTLNTTVAYRRIYDDPQPDDGHRVLVDRVWPRKAGRELLGLLRPRKEGT